MLPHELVQCTNSSATTPFGACPAAAASDIAVAAGRPSSTKSESRLYSTLYSYAELETLLYARRLFTPE
jgi:hypothetical protein